MPDRKALQWNIARPDDDAIHAIMREFKVTRPTALVLANRDVPNEAIPSFLNPRLQDLSDPYLLPGARTAAARIWQAVQRNERILVHGDYDVDGITSTALLVSVLRAVGAGVDSFLPHRLEDGYGLTAASLEKSVKEHQLIITVDCGITSFEAANYAKQRDVDLIITDHHQPAGVLPEAVAVCNPKIVADKPEAAHLQCLAGVGVAFKIAHALLKYGRDEQLGGETVDLRNYLDLVALGTIADMVPLWGENRCLVRYGMHIMSQQGRPGIRALCDHAKLSETVRAQDVAFRLAPRINAAGRLADPNCALKLLLTESYGEAMALAADLDALNTERQRVERASYLAAEAQIEKLQLENSPAMVVAGENWVRGVVGIVASRIVQAYDKPAIALAIEDGIAHGSARSVPGVDLVAALRECDSLLSRYGGHPMAAGLKLDVANLDAFREKFSLAVQGETKGEPYQPTLDCDGETTFRELSSRFFAELDELRPFGHSNRPPTFCFEGVSPRYVKSLGEHHTRGQLFHCGYGMPFIAFNRTPEEFSKDGLSVAAVPQLWRQHDQDVQQLEILDVRTEALR